MKIIEILKKLGILRSGKVSGTYKNYEEMPDELKYDNVYHKDTDLVKNQKTNSVQKKSSVLLFWLLLSLSTIIILFSLVIMTITIWFFLSLLIFLFLIYQLFSYKKGGVIAIKILGYLVIFIFISIVFLFISLGGESDTTDKEQTNLSKTTDCKKLAEEYDNKIFKITSTDKLKGKIGFKIDKNTCQYEITWHTLFESNLLEKNVHETDTPNTNYDYVADIIFEKEGPNPLDGNIDPVFTNKDKLPTDIFNHRVPYDFYLTPGLIAGTDKTSSTETFHHVMQSSGTFSQATIDGILAVKKIKIFNRENGTEEPTTVEFNINVRYNSVVYTFELN